MAPYKDPIELTFRKVFNVPSNVIELGMKELKHNDDFRLANLVARLKHISVKYDIQLEIIATSDTGRTYVICKNDIDATTFKLAYDKTDDDVFISMKKDPFHTIEWLPDSNKATVPSDPIEVTIQEPPPWWLFDSIKKMTTVFK